MRVTGFPRYFWTGGVTCENERLLQMSATTTLLSQFEQQYSVNTAEITAKIGQLSQLPKSEQATGVNEIRRMLAEVEDLLEQMELSVRELDSTG